MRALLPAALAAFPLLLLLPGSASAQCGGLCLYEIGTPDQGRSAAGAGARAQDAATSYWNAAGMTRLDGTHVMFGSSIGFANLKYNGKATSVDSANPGAGDTGNAGTTEGGDTGNIIPLVGSFVSANPWDELRVGMSLTALYGGAADYKNNWVGRSFVTKVNLSGLNLQPVVAYPVTDWLSLGAGFSAVYVWFDLDLRVSLDDNAATINIDNADDWGFAGVFSALIEPWDHTRIGITYRTKTELDLDGKAETPTALGNVPFEAEFDLPQGVNVSLFHQVHEDVALFFDAAWSDWSDFGKQTWQIGAIPPALEIDRNWKDTWRLGVGTEVAVHEKILLQGGFSYDSSPVPSNARLPDIPVGEAYRFSGGLRAQVHPNIELGVTYTGLWFGDPRVNKTVLPPVADPTAPREQVILNGEYDPSWIHWIGATLTVNF